MGEQRPNYLGDTQRDNIKYNGAASDPHVGIVTEEQTKARVLQS